MTERDPLWLQGGNYTGTEDRLALAAIFGSRHFVDLAPSTSPLVSAGGGHGVVGEGDMAVAAGAGTAVTVSLGLALVRGTQQGDQGVYITSNDASKSLTISAADATNPRKDLIVTRVKDAEFGISGDTGPLEVVTGTPTSGLTAGNATGRPTPPENALVLAEVLVPAAAASSASYTITDLRTRAYSLGGVGVCTSTNRPAPPYTGQLIFETDTTAVMVYSGGAWVELSRSGAWLTRTPTLTGFGTVSYNTQSYKFEGKKCLARGSITLSAALTGAPTVNLPVAAITRANFISLGVARYQDTGTKLWTGTCHIASGATTIGFVHSGAAGTGNVDATNPFTFGNTDTIEYSIVYETA